MGQILPQVSSQKIRQQELRSCRVNHLLGYTYKDCIHDQRKRFTCAATAEAQGERVCKIQSLAFLNLQLYYVEIQLVDRPRCDN